MSPSFRVHQEQQEELENNKKSRLFFSPRISRSLFRHTAVFCLSLSVGILLHEVNLVQEERRTGYITSTHEAKRDMEQSDKQRREREVKALFFLLCVYYWSGFRDIGGCLFSAAPAARWDQ